MARESILLATVILFTKLWQFRNNPGLFLVCVSVSAELLGRKSGIKLKKLTHGG